MIDDLKLNDVNRLIWGLRFYADGGKDDGEKASMALDLLTHYGFCHCGKIVKRKLGGGALHSHTDNSSVTLSPTSGRRVAYQKCPGSGEQPLRFDTPPKEIAPQIASDDPRSDTEIRFSLLELS